MGTECEELCQAWGPGKGLAEAPEGDEGIETAKPKPQKVKFPITSRWGQSLRCKSEEVDRWG